jgi:hypothetical protein
MDDSSFPSLFPLTIDRRRRITFTADTDDSSQPEQPPTIPPDGDKRVNEEFNDDLGEIFPFDIANSGMAFGDCDESQTCSR